MDIWETWSQTPSIVRLPNYELGNVVNAAGHLLIKEQANQTKNLKFPFILPFPAASMLFCFILQISNAWIVMESYVRIKG